MDLLTIEIYEATESQFAGESYLYINKTYMKIISKEIM